jgi:zinc transporter ZupT
MMALADGSRLHSYSEAGGVHSRGGHAAGSALFGLLNLPPATGVLPYVRALSAASFIYATVVNLVPALRRRATLRSGVLQLVLIVAGITTIVLLHQH